MIPKTNTAPGRSPAGGGMFLGNASLPRNAHAPSGRPSPKAHCSIEISDIRCGIPFGDDFEIIFQAIRFRKQPNKLEFDVIIIRRAYVMTPPTRREFPISWFNGKGSFIP